MNLSISRPVLIFFTITITALAAQAQEKKPGYYMEQAARERNKRNEEQKSSPTYQPQKETKTGVKQQSNAAPVSSASDPDVPTDAEKAQQDAKDLATEEAYRASSARYDAEQEEKNKREFNNPVRFCSGDAAVAKKSFNYRMDVFMDTHNYDRAIAAYDSLYSYRTKEISSRDTDWNDLMVIADGRVSQAYYAKNDYLNGIHHWRLGYYLPADPVETERLEYSQKYWEAYRHLPDHKELLDSIMKINQGSLSVINYNPKAYISSVDGYAIEMYARCEIELGRYDVAEKMLTGFLDYRKGEGLENFSYYYYRALARYKMGDYKNAKKDCKKSLQINETIGSADAQALLALIEKQ